MTAATGSIEDLLRDVFPEGQVIDAPTVDKILEGRKAYAVFILPRSGSSWLTDICRKSGHLGVPHEWFNIKFLRVTEPVFGCTGPIERQTSDVNSYLRSISLDDPECFGIQLSQDQTKFIRNLMYGFDSLERIEFFYLRRRNICAQAISLYRSFHSGIWHSFQGKIAATDVPIELDHEKALTYVNNVINQERWFESFFKICNLKPDPLFYEDILDDPLKCLTHISNKMGLPEPEAIPVSDLEILRNEQSVRWAEELRCSQGFQELVQTRPAF